MDKCVKHEWRLEITLQFVKDDITVESFPLSQREKGILSHHGDLVSNRDMQIMQEVEEWAYGLQIRKWCNVCGDTLDGTIEFSDGSVANELNNQLFLDELERTPAVQGRLSPR